MTLDPFARRADIDDRVDRAIGPNPSPAPTPTNQGWFTFTAQDLRGIPAIGRGVQGCIPETEPGWNLDHWPIPSGEEAA